ncbi:hypothetical protein V493_02440 [Pseudogymnoascus sp. VKM F-4281 (FW-2241)]|nr:hypothetical protein V493_02440 [Pseudogymnoascus sp. VKM F-4281 (FW-2241)]
MGRLFNKLLGRGKTANAEAASTAERTVVSGTDATPLPPEPDLYSTKGSIGIKVVAEPSNADLDIVFVHGLTGNREATWTHENGVFWPTLLAQDINTARIMIFGYDADIVNIFGMAGGNNLRNHGKSLAFKVSDRRSNCRDRPIFFIAHSLGGLVCAQALLHCREGDKRLEKVFQSTRGIIFMGTPHAGADLAELGYRLAKALNYLRKTNSAILRPLRQDSDELTAVQQQFQQLASNHRDNLNIFCFFEEKAVVGVDVIVPERSATLSQYSNQSIAANHMDMTKFSGTNDDGYQSVLGQIRITIEEMNSSDTSCGDLKIHPDDEKRKKCHKIFSAPDYQRYKDRNKYPVEGTCQWFLRHPNYTGWRDSDSSSILWVSADPGCGKSVLSKLLVDKELPATKSRSTCYFFFKDDNDGQKAATSALCALLHQIFAQKPELLGHAVEVFDQNEEERLKTSVDLLWQVLITAAEDTRAGEIVCILDALDECRHSELGHLLEKLCSFYDERSRTSSGMALKFLVTSRPLQHIEAGFKDLSRKIPAIRLAGEEHTTEILYETGLVIEHEIEEIQQEFPMNSITVGILRDEFTKVENRTYLWLMLIFDLIRQDLQSVMTSTEREKLFHTIPKSVDTAYTAILNKSTNKDRARKLLNIVCAATEPLSLKEITTALLIQENNEKYDDLEMPPDGFSKTYIRNLCGLFVSVIDGRVFLLHQTAKEFLMANGHCNQSALGLPRDEIWKNSVTTQDSSFLLASVCMWFLQLQEFKGSSIKQEDIDQLVSKYEFLEYSAMNWAVHFRAAMVPDGDPLLDLAFNFCDVQVDRHLTFKLMIEHDHPRYNEVYSFKSLHVASYLGLENVVGQLLATPGIEVNKADDHGRTPLYWAAREGYEEVVGKLLAAPGVEVNKADDDGYTPLWWAAYKWHKEVIGQLLAAPGIEVNNADDHGRTPLYWAACEGYEEVVGKLLAAPGVEVNKADDDGYTPLWWAAYKGHKEVIGQLLAAPGIDVNKADDEGRTPLWRAVEKGQKEVVGQLLAAPSIEVNKADNDGRTPLCWAGGEGHKEIVGKLLAAPRIDVNKADDEGCTPLWYAVAEGHEVVGQLLATPGVEVNKADDDGYTPLWWAAYKGHKEVIGQLLAAPGIEVNKADNKECTPLCCAVAEGHKEVVGQLLAATSIEVNKADNDGCMPLWWAAYKGHEEAVGQLLATPGIDVNAADKYGNTPLSVARDGGHEGIVTLLESRLLVAAKSLEKT